MTTGKTLSTPNIIPGRRNFLKVAAAPGGSAADRQLLYVHYDTTIGDDILIKSDLACCFGPFRGELVWPGLLQVRAAA
ncbi:hypothetical protein [Aestuariivirga sp.]|uniref:hypothetical protein n=1 Tax=Aestuariivirga sp. TaxID=2650926 RepID=UPI0035931759